MCQIVTGPQVTLKRRIAYKVFTGKPTELRGVYFSPGGLLSRVATFGRDQTYIATPSSYDGKTRGGYHVFATERGAERYRITERGFHRTRLYIIKVRVWGAALPFDDMYGNKGWAVENLLIPSR